MTGLNCYQTKIPYTESEQILNLDTQFTAIKLNFFEVFVSTIVFPFIYMLIS